VGMQHTREGWSVKFKFVLGDFESPEEFDGLSVSSGANIRKVARRFLSRRFIFRKFSTYLTILITSLDKQSA